MKRVSKLPHWPPRLPIAPGWLRWRAIPKAVLALLTTAILTVLVFSNLNYYQIGSRLEQVRPGQPMPRDIIAPRAIEWEDHAETERKRNDAANLVPTAYVFNAQAATSAQTDLAAIFTGISELRSSDDKGRVHVLDQVPQHIIDAALVMDDETLNHLQREASEILESVMQTRIEEGRTEQEAADRVRELAQTYEAKQLNLRVLTAVTLAVLQPTWVQDESRTETLRQEARAQVATVIRPLRTGEIIIRKGDILTDQVLAQLKTNEVLTPAPLSRIIPLGAIMLFAVISLGVFVRSMARVVYEDQRKLVLLVGLIIAVLWATMTLGGENEYLVSLMAIPAGCMAIAGLLGIPIAIASTILLGVVSGLAADHQFAIVLLTTGSALTGIMAVSSIWPASRALPAIVSLIAVNLLLLIGVNAILPGGEFGGHELWTQLGNMALQAGAGGLGATFIAVGAIYILARPFGITTHYRLMELSNPNEPLLRRMMIEAPGSYHSSVMVANIAEAAADAIGANALLTRVAAMYHDIGKLKRPGFFVENQAPLGIENMHQRLSPKLSYLILTSHVKEGVETAREYKLPAEVISVIREHHGTTLVAYFYHRAVSEAGGDKVEEHEFRYPGPKPSTREAAVVMLADSVQASVKSLKEPTPSRIEHMVDSIINNRLDDGQFEDCAITLRDLRRISEVLIRILTGLYTYTRIEYPDIKGERTRLRANLNSEPASPQAGTPTAATPGG